MNVDRWMERWGAWGKLDEVSIMEMLQLPLLRQGKYRRFGGEK